MRILHAFRAQRAVAGAEYDQLLSCAEATGDAAVIELARAIAAGSKLADRATKLASMIEELRDLAYGLLIAAERMQS